MPTTLFKKVEEHERRSLRIPVLVNQAEKNRIAELAGIRQLSSGDYLRRAGLQRKADVHFDVEIVLALSDLTRAVRRLHVDMVALGVEPPSELMLQVLIDARSAMLRISK